MFSEAFQLCVVDDNHNLYVILFFISLSLPLLFFHRIWDKYKNVSLYKMLFHQVSSCAPAICWHSNKVVTFIDYCIQTPTSCDVNYDWLHDLLSHFVTSKNCWNSLSVIFWSTIFYWPWLNNNSTLIFFTLCEKIFHSHRYLARVHKHSITVLHLKRVMRAYIYALTLNCQTFCRGLIKKRVKSYTHFSVLDWSNGHDTAHKISLPKPSEYKFSFFFCI